MSRELRSCLVEEIITITLKVLLFSLEKSYDIGSWEKVMETPYILGPLKCVVKSLQRPGHKWCRGVGIRRYPPAGGNADRIYTIVFEKHEVRLLYESVSVFLHERKRQKTLSML